MSVQRTVTVEEPPAKALAALATAGENLEYTVRRIDPEAGVLVMTSPWTREAVSFGYIATGRIAAADPPEVKVEIDVTPRMGFWSLKGSGEQADEIIRELSHVLYAPKARIRRPNQSGKPHRPFGYRPEVAGVLWALLAVLFYGLGVGGEWWIAAAAGVVGGLLLARPFGNRVWSFTVAILGLLSFPFGVIGWLLRREALAQALWRKVKGTH